jgi:CheY-like chemotaxis protein
MNIKTPKILIVDDNAEIHNDFRKVLAPATPAPQLGDLESTLFGEAPQATVSYTLDSAYQGADALKMVKAALEKSEPYGLVFVDVRMPPGMDGVETIQAIRKLNPNVDCIICTAYSDYTPESARQKIGITEGLLFISKPFDPDIIRQLAKKMRDAHIRKSA